jgi:hypothetical protein
MNIWQHCLKQSAVQLVRVDNLLLLFSVNLAHQKVFQVSYNSHIILNKRWVSTGLLYQHRAYECCNLVRI